MEKRLALTWLYDFYGPLLTPHRRALLQLFCEEDLSPSEIAQQTGITRQGVHDALKSAEEKLETYEAKLGLVERFRGIARAAADCRAALLQVSPCAARDEALEALGRIEWENRE